MDAEESALFCRLARLTHDLGLDWWHISRGVQVRFGWKEPNAERANAVLGTLQERGALFQFAGRSTEWTRSAVDH